MNNTNTRSAIENQLQQYKAWSEKLANQRLRAREEAYLEQDLADECPTALVNIADSLGMLATVLAMEGINAVRTQDKSGWQKIHLSCAYRLQALEIAIPHLQQGWGAWEGSKAATLLNDIAHVFSYAVAMGFEEEARCHGLLLANLLRSPAWPAADPVAAYRQWPLMAVQLHCRLQQGSWDAKLTGQMHNTVYREVLAGWEIPQAFNNAFLMAADYHCAQMQDTSDELPAEFMLAPFDLVPFDLLAMLAVQRKEQRSTALLHHPLLDSTFAAVTPLETLLNDHWLVAVKNRLAR